MPERRCNAADVVKGIFVRCARPKGHSGNHHYQAVR